MAAQQVTKGTRVKFKTAHGEQMTGRITECLKYKHYRIKGDDNGNYVTDPNAAGSKADKKSITVIPFGIFVFDTALSSGLKSKRHSGTFWQEFCHANGWSYASKQVHSMADICYFLGRAIPESLIIFNGHGSEKTGLSLTNGDRFSSHWTGEGWCVCSTEKHCDSVPPLKLHELNKNKIFLFSSCHIGANEKLCKAFRSMLQARAVIGYRTTAYDSLCYIAESTLSLLLEKTDNPQKATESVKQNLKILTGFMDENTRSFPIVCY